MQYTTEKVIPTPDVLACIARVAIAHDYYTEKFVTAGAPLCNLLVTKPSLLPAHELARAQFATLRWTIVTARNGRRIVGFAATEEVLQPTKGCSIVWFFVVPKSRNLVEPALLLHLEQNDANGCADLYFEADLDIAMWRRLLRNGYRPWSPRTYARSANESVIAMDLLYKSMQHIGGMFPPEWLERLEKIRAHEKTVDEAVELIRDESATLELFCERFATLIITGTPSHMIYRKLLMPDALYLPAGPIADTLPLFSF